MSLIWYFCSTLFSEPLARGHLWVSKLEFENWLKKPEKLHQVNLLPSGPFRNSLKGLKLRRVARAWAKGRPRALFCLISPHICKSSDPKRSSPKAEWWALFPSHLSGPYCNNTLESKAIVLERGAKVHFHHFAPFYPYPSRLKFKAKFILSPPFGT